MKRSDNYLINDIKESIKSIEEYLSELNYNKENFLSNRRMQKLMIYEIIMIGEAATKISIETKNNYPNINWREISDMRNFLIHEYYEVSNNIIWETANKDIPKLKENIYSIKTE
ncbi:HepT-like ribonuclease domain-containing protein [Brachyspira aalborgi]|uniref:HepT-like ribonuclease domain-containing protein n=1 Tax=Brachyspira aalborgi TaxID=29522 RepID=UPI0026655940|nr:HepT-like ribonuclease domain-containing protein [Brachyspira aalborgi]